MNVLKNRYHRYGKSEKTQSTGKPSLVGVILKEMRMALRELNLGPIEYATHLEDAPKLIPAGTSFSGGDTEPRCKHVLS